MTYRELAATLGKEISGNSDYDGSPAAYSNLSPEDRITLTNRIKAYIRANPEGFSQNTRLIAGSADILSPENYSALDMATDFIDEAANQAEQINPLSAQNRGKLAIVLIAALFLGVGIYAYFKAAPGTAVAKT